MEKGGGKKNLIEVACPNCGGVTKISNGDKFPIYTCHVGHRFSELAFGASFAEYTEGKLWEAYRTLEENKSFHEMCRERAVKINDHERASACRTMAVSLESQARTLRELIDKFIEVNAGTAEQSSKP